eukprot:TRINITY_DN80597_c0_g1_i1.p1 TRINITY_DN80597_c0_g1~~TRINITY_DN80597_c0_g1_i1.p1  ORF type:complete len:1002 (+),score=393.29 TRINITY_DN80597_c0_g1_i1:83-3088(+)
MDEVSRLRMENADLQWRAKKYEELKDSEEIVRESKKKAEKLSQEIRTMQERNEELLERWILLSREKSEVTKRLEEAEEECVSLRVELSGIQERTNDTQKSYSQLQDDLVTRSAQFEEDHKRTEEKLALLMRKKDELEAQLLARDESMRKLQREIDQKRVLEEKISDLEHNVRLSEAEHKELTETKKKLEQALRENRALEQRIRELEEEVSSKSEVTVLETKKLDAQLAEAVKDKKQLEDDSQYLQEQVQKLEEELGKKRGLEKKLIDLEDKVQTLQREKSALEEQCTALESRRVENEDEMNEMTSLLKNENGRLRREMEIMKERDQAKQEELDSLTDSTRIAHVEKEKMREKCSDLESKLQTIEQNHDQEMVEMRESTRMWEEKTLSLSSDLRLANDKIVRLEKETRRLKGDVKEMEDVVDSVKRQKEDLSLKYASQAQDIQRLETDLNQWKQKSAVLSAQMEDYEAIQAELDETKAGYADMRSKCKLFEDQVEQMEVDHAQNLKILEDELSKAQLHCADVEAMCEEIDKERARADADAKTLGERCGELTRKCKELEASKKEKERAEEEAYDQAIATLEEQMRGLREKNVELAKKYMDLRREKEGLARTQDHDVSRLEEEVTRLREEVAMQQFQPTSAASTSSRAPQSGSDSIGNGSHAPPLPPPRRTWQAPAPSSTSVSHSHAGRGDLRREDSMISLNDFDEIMERLNELSRRNESLESKFESVEAEKNELIRILDERKRENVSLLTEIEQLHRSAQDTIVLEKQRQTSEIIGLGDDIDHLKKENMDLVRRIEDIQRTMKLSEEDSQRKVTQMQQQREMCERRLREKSDAAETLQKEVFLWKDRYEKEEREKANLSSSLKRFNDMKIRQERELKALQEENKALKTTVQHYKGEVEFQKDQSRRRSDRIGRPTTDVRLHYEKEIEQMTKKHDDLIRKERTELTNERQMRLRLTSELGRVNRSLETMQRERDELADENARLSRKLMSVESELEAQRSASSSS